MNEGNLPNKEDLPVDVSELGELQAVEQECPGVYYFAVKSEDSEDSLDLFPREYYLVMENAPISKEARSYGKPFQNGQGLLFALGEDNSGDKIIEYEICRYKLHHGHPADVPDSLHELAVYNAEYYPDYFGSYPAPTLTPHGYMVRYRTLDNGIHLLETDQGTELVAFCFPLWNVLSIFAQKAGEHTDYDIQHGIDNTKGYLFFTKSRSCIAFFELWAEHPAWAESHVFNFPAIMNAIWEHYPNYATVYNLVEQKGLNNITGTLLDVADEIDLSVRPEKMFALTPEIGTDFINISDGIKQQSIKKYIEKFGALLSSCTYTHKFHTTDIQPKYHDNPQFSEVWTQGALNGVMIHFIRTLTDDENIINGMVLREVANKLGDPDVPIDMNDYIEAALVVLNRLGYPIPKQED